MSNRILLQRQQLVGKRVGLDVEEKENDTASQKKKSQGSSISKWGVATTQGCVSLVAGACGALQGRIQALLIS